MDAVKLAKSFRHRNIYHKCSNESYDYHYKYLCSLSYFPHISLHAVRHPCPTFSNVLSRGVEHHTI